MSEALLKFCRLRAGTAAMRELLFGQGEDILAEDVFDHAPDVQGHLELRVELARLAPANHPSIDSHMHIHLVEVRTVV